MAGQYTSVLEGSYQASAEVSAKRFVVLTGDQSVARAGVRGQRVQGVAYASISATGVDYEGGTRNEITAGKAVAVHILGMPFCVSGGVFGRDVELATDEFGRAILAESGDRVVAISQKASGAAGELVPVLLTPGGRIIP